jgi:hypothetical protein
MRKVLGRSSGFHVQEQVVPPTQPNIKVEEGVQPTVRRSRAYKV